MVKSLGGRKFMFALLVTAMSFALVLTKSLGVAEWLKFIEVIGATYVVGNVTSKFIQPDKVE